VTERVLVRPIEKRSLLATLIVLLGLFLALNSLDGILWGNQNHSMPSLFPNGVNSFISVDGARLYWANLGVWLLVALLVGAMFSCSTALARTAHASHRVDRESAALAGSDWAHPAAGWGISRRSGPWQGCSSRRSILTPSVSARCSPPHLRIGRRPLRWPRLAGGAVIAGLLIGVAESMLSGYVSAIGGSSKRPSPSLPSSWSCSSPAGLFGSKEVERV